MMNVAKTIDFKGLRHTEKEDLILRSIWEIADNETLRIILGFNPLPLVYMLYAQGQFDIQYEKEGPDEWILKVTRIASREDK